MPGSLAERLLRRCRRAPGSGVSALRGFALLVVVLLLVPGAPGRARLGNDRFDVRLMNVSSRPCTVQGYPGLGFLGRRGQVEHVPVHRGSGMLSQDPGPHLLLVRPHASVSASVGYTPNCSKPDASDGNVPASIQITPPDERDHVTTAIDQRIQICGNGVTVTALVAGSGGVRAPGGGHT